MARGNFPLYALNAGEVSKTALARVDVAKLRLAAQCQVNWLPFVTGPAMLRPGFEYIGEVLNDAIGRSIPFVFSKLDTARLELTANTMRVWIDDVLVTRPSVTTTISDPNFTGSGGWVTSDTTAGCSISLSPGNGLEMAAIVGGLCRARQTVSVPSGSQNVEHGVRIVVGDGPVTVRIGSSAGLSDYVATTNLDIGTHSLAFTPASSFTIEIESKDLWQKQVVSCTVDPAGTLTLPTPWGASDIPNVRYDQSADIIYVACRNVPPYKIERRSLHGWSVAQFISLNGPFQNAPGSPAQLVLGANYGSTTLSSDIPYFEPGHVGALFQIFIPIQGGIVANLGGAAAFTNPIRVSGVGGDRALGMQTTGTWSGTLNVERSYSGPTEGFVQVAKDNNTSPNNGSFTSNINYGEGSGSPWFDGANSANSGVLGLDNVVVWYRIGFEPNEYTSGNVVVTFTFNGGGVWAICRVTGYSGPTEVGVDIIQNGAGPHPSQQWQESYWSTASTGSGYPTSVTFHEGRLWWFGQGFWYGSQSDDFTGFASQDSQGNALGDDGVIIGSFGSGPADTVSWGLSLTRLLMGREQSIASARSSNFDQPLTPTDIVVRDCSDQGAERLPAVKLGKRGIFVQQSGSRVYELAFNASEADYDDTDLTRLNFDIGKPGFAMIDKSIQLDHIVWLPRNDGQVAGLLRDVKEDISAWFRFMTLGVIEDVCVLPTSGLEDLVYFTVRRVINGATRRFVEKLAPRTNCVGGPLNQCLDCHVIYQGAATNSITLAQLPLTEVAVWADGAFIGTGTTSSAGVLSPLPDGKEHSTIIAGLAGSVQVASMNAALPNNQLPDTILGAPSQSMFVGAQYNGYPVELFADIGAAGRPPQHVGSITVVNGLVTMPNNQTASTMVAFIGYVAPFMSAKLAYAAQGATALTMKKKVDHLGLVMYDTATGGAGGLLIGQDMSCLDPMPTLEGGAVPVPGSFGAATVYSEYDGPLQAVPGRWDTDARLCMVAQAPNPATLGGVVVAMGTNER